MPNTFNTSWLQALYEVGGTHLVVLSGKFYEKLIHLCEMPPEFSLSMQCVSIKLAALLVTPTQGLLQGHVHITSEILALDLTV